MDGGKDAELGQARQHGLDAALGEDELDLVANAVSGDLFQQAACLADKLDGAVLDAKAEALLEAHGAQQASGVFYK